jgi:hypothetical protein
MIGSQGFGRFTGACVIAALAAASRYASAQNVAGDPLFTEGFDGVTAPALPPGWVATNDQGPDPLWATDAGKWDTAPNSAHVDDPGVVADKWLDSPPIYIYTNEAELRFQQVTEFCIGDMASFYDGGVLEISIDGGPFQDIQDAGGTADYDGPIVGAGNPLEGRQGWTWRSNIGAFVFTDAIVTLPPVGGKSIVLRWRLGASGLPSVNGHYGWWIDSVRICDGAPCGTSPVPARLDADPSGNGVWEPGETVDVDPYYYNDGSGTILDLIGVGNLIGPPGAYDYKILLAEAQYGSIAPGALGGCIFTGFCYSVQVSNPSERPAAHWDMQLVEELSTGPTVTWALHVGNSFADVPNTDLFYRNVETVYHRGVTGGCGGTNYCPDSPALRKQMAVFLLKSRFGSFYVPPAAAGIFADVPASDPFAPWIENLYNLGVTGGCSASPLNYCPDQTVLRKQMAVFLLKALNGSGYVPPACQGIFPDVPCANPFAPWIEDLASRQIAAGCGSGDFCPDNPNTRGQMAVFLTKTFGLTLYGP